MNTSDTGVNFIQEFEKKYATIHVGMVTLICCLGIPCQIIMLIVLGGKGIFSPTNLFLMSLSTSQLCLLVNNLFKVIHDYLTDVWCNGTSYAWVCVMLVIVNFSIVFHNIAVFHVVALSVIRYISIGWFARRQAPWFTMRKARSTALCLYTSVIFLAIPFYINSRIREQKQVLKCGPMKGENGTIYEIELHNDALSQFNYWLMAVLGKLAPCCVLLVMSVLLANELKKLNRISRAFIKTGRQHKSVRSYSGATHMILMVMVLFLAVELPQGVLTLLTALLPPLAQTVYQPLGDFFEMLTLLYSSVNFVLFCLMSEPFRRSFCDTFCCRRACLHPETHATTDFHNEIVGHTRKSMIPVMAVMDYYPETHNNAMRPRSCAMNIRRLSPNAAASPMGVLFKTRQTSERPVTDMVNRALIIDSPSPPISPDGRKRCHTFSTHAQSVPESLPTVRRANTVHRQQRQSRRQPRLTPCSAVVGIEDTNSLAHSFTSEPQTAVITTTPLIHGRFDGVRHPNGTCTTAARPQLGNRMSRTATDVDITVMVHAPTPVSATKRNHARCRQNAACAAILSRDKRVCSSETVTPTDNCVLTSEESLEISADIQFNNGLAEFNNETFADSKKAASTTCVDGLSHDYNQRLPSPPQGGRTCTHELLASRYDENALHSDTLIRNESGILPTACGSSAACTGKTEKASASNKDDDHVMRDSGEIGVRTITSEDTLTTPKRCVGELSGQRFEERDSHWLDDEPYTVLKVTYI